MNTCEFRSSCALYIDLKGRRPITLDSIKKEYCDSDYSHCARFMVSKVSGPGSVSEFLFPEDIDEACEILGERH